MALFMRIANPVETSLSPIPRSQNWFRFFEFAFRRVRPAIALPSRHPLARLANPDHLQSSLDNLFSSQRAA
jgi:hypothetical protein